MNVVAPKTTLCTGETVVYTVQVLQSYVGPPRGWTGPGLPKPVALSRVVVNALARDASIGKFRAPQTRSTSLIASPEGDEPPSSTFTFTASKNPGKSVLYFDGMVAGYDIHTDYVDFNMPITVIHCKYKVSATSQWIFSAEYGTGFVFAFINESPVGYRLPGQTEFASFRAENVPVAWVGYNRIPNYGSFVSLNYGTATITGKVLDDQLQVNIEFGRMTGSDGELWSSRLWWRRTDICRGSAEFPNNGRRRDLSAVSRIKLDRQWHGRAWRDHRNGDARGRLQMKQTGRGPMNHPSASRRPTAALSAFCLAGLAGLYAVTAGCVFVKPRHRGEEVTPSMRMCAFGSGAIDFPETTAGLADLASYRSTLTLSFDGQDAGEPYTWTKTYEMTASKDPAFRELTIEKTSNRADTSRSFIIEAEGSTYEQHGEDSPAWQALSSRRVACLKNGAGRASDRRHGRRRCRHGYAPQRASQSLHFR